MDCIKILTWHFWERQPAFLRWLEEIKVLPMTSEVTYIPSQKIRISQSPCEVAEWSSHWV